MLEISVIVALIYSYLIGKTYLTKNMGAKFTISFNYNITMFIRIMELLYWKKKKEKKNRKNLHQKTTGLKGIFSRAIITLSCVPYKAYTALKAIIKTLNRLIYTHKNLLEWMTSEEAEKQAKTDLISYYKNMISNVVIGAISILGYILYKNNNILLLILGILWIIAPFTMWYISKEKKGKNINRIIN